MNSTELEELFTVTYNECITTFYDKFKSYAPLKDLIEFEQFSNAKEEYSNIFAYDIHLLQLKAKEYSIKCTDYFVEALKDKYKSFDIADTLNNFEQPIWRAQKYFKTYFAYTLWNSINTYFANDLENKANQTNVPPNKENNSADISIAAANKLIAEYNFGYYKNYLNKLVCGELTIIDVVQTELDYNDRELKQCQAKGFGNLTRVFIHSKSVILKYIASIGYYQFDRKNFKGWITLSQRNADKKSFTNLHDFKKLWREISYNTDTKGIHKQDLKAIFANEYLYIKQKFDAYFNEFEIIPLEVFNELIFEFRQSFAQNGRVEGVNYFDDLIQNLISSKTEQIKVVDTFNSSTNKPFDTVAPEAKSLNLAETGRLIYILVAELNFSSHQDNSKNCEFYCSQYKLKYTDVVRQNFKDCSKIQLQTIHKKLNSLQILDNKTLIKFNKYAINELNLIS